MKSWADLSHEPRFPPTQGCVASPTRQGVPWFTNKHLSELQRYLQSISANCVALTGWGTSIAKGKTVVMNQIILTSRPSQTQEAKWNPRSRDPLKQTASCTNCRISTFGSCAKQGRSKWRLRIIAIALPLRCHWRLNHCHWCNYIITCCDPRHHRFLVSQNSAPSHSDAIPARHCTSLYVTAIHWTFRTKKRDARGKGEQTRHVLSDSKTFSFCKEAKP